jgi:DegV family protein with EDD domain
MQRVRIVTDSTADVPTWVAERLGITVIPAYVQIGGQSLRDGEHITRTEFYEMLPTLQEIPTTAVPPAAEFTEAFRSQIGQAESVIAITLSSKVSGLYNSARLGSEEVSELPVHLVDSGQLSMGCGWQVIVAAEAAVAGKGVEEILSIIERVQPRIRVLAALDTMENLRRGGRVDWARAMAARLLDIKPLIEFQQGEAVLVGRARTRGKAIERLLEMAADFGSLERVAVLHSSSPDVSTFTAQVADAKLVEEVIVSEVGPVVGTHIGKGALGIAAIVAS